MRRNLTSAIIVFFIISCSFTILLYGINIVSNNMNSLYSNSQNNYTSYSQTGDVIPAFIDLRQIDPYVYELMFMGSGFKMDFNELIDNIIYIRDSITYFIRCLPPLIPMLLQVAE